MALTPEQIRHFIAVNAQRLGVDPYAALAVASTEGGFGGAIGDEGTSFGPFKPQSRTSCAGSSGPPTRKAKSQKRSGAIPPNQFNP